MSIAGVVENSKVVSATFSASWAASRRLARVRRAAARFGVGAALVDFLVPVLGRCARSIERLPAGIENSSTAEVRARTRLSCAEPPAGFAWRGVGGAAVARRVDLRTSFSAAPGAARLLRLTTLGMWMQRISEPCVRDQACVEVRVQADPEDRMLYINPDECIDCGACEPACREDGGICGAEHDRGWVHPAGG